MLLTLIIIFFIGFGLKKIKSPIPNLVFMILFGIILFKIGLVSDSLIQMSPIIRKIILVVILIRAGISLDINRIKTAGIPVILLSFIPALFEILAVMIFAPILFGISIAQAGLLGCVLSAVSPAIIVPKMINLIKQKPDSNVPDIIIAAASIDDAFVLVMFSSFLSLNTAGSFTIDTILKLPISIILAILFGVIFGKIIEKLTVNAGNIQKVIIILSISLLAIYLEKYIPFSALITILLMCIGKGNESLKNIFAKIWVPAEILLFTLVGISTSTEFLMDNLILAIVLISVGLMFRSAGVLISLIKSSLNKSQKVYTVIAFVPKATVQASIGAIPLSLGLASGNLILTVSSIAILFTASVGSVLMDKFEDLI